MGIPIKLYNEPVTSCLKRVRVQEVNNTPLQPYIGNNWVILPSARSPPEWEERRRLTHPYGSHSTFGIDWAKVEVIPGLLEDRQPYHRISLLLYDKSFCRGIYLLPNHQWVQFSQPFLNVGNILLLDLTTLILTSTNAVVILSINQDWTAATIFRWFSFSNNYITTPLCHDIFIPGQNYKTLLRFNNNTNNRCQCKLSLFCQFDLSKRWDFNLQLPRRNRRNLSEFKYLLNKHFIFLYNSCNIWIYPFVEVNEQNLMQLKDRLAHDDIDKLSLEGSIDLKPFLYEDEYVKLIHDVNNLQLQTWLIHTNKRLVAMTINLRQSRVLTQHSICSGLTPQTQISTSCQGEIILILTKHTYHCSVTLYQWYSSTGTWIMSGCNEVNNVADKMLTLYGNDLPRINPGNNTKRLGYILVQDTYTAGRIADYQILDIHTMAMGTNCD